jgi:hypothetical protein
VILPCFMTQSGNIFQYNKQDFMSL